MIRLELSESRSGPRAGVGLGGRQGGGDSLAPRGSLILACSPQHLLSLSSLPLRLLHVFQLLLQLSLRLQQLLHLQTERGIRDISASLKRRLTVMGSSEQGELSEKPAGPASSLLHRRGCRQALLGDAGSPGPPPSAQLFTEHPPVPAAVGSRAAGRGAGPAFAGVTDSGTGISQWSHCLVIDLH